MRWNVEAADPNTGEDTVITVDARDEAEAEKAARNRGYLVSGVYQPTAQSPQEALDALAAASRTSPGMPLGYSVPTARTPQYEPIVKGAALLRRNATLYVVMGSIILIIGMVAAIGTVVLAVNGQLAPSAAAGGVLVGLGALMIAVSLFNLATLIRLTAELSLAVRDIARNSFR